MKVKVLYFALLRDAVGHASDVFDVPDAVATAGALRDYITGLGEPWEGAFAAVKRIRCAVDQDMADDDTPVADGAEVAFFPPVTGG